MRKGVQEGKWSLVWREKKERVLQPEWGVDLICNYLPDDQSVFEVDWLPGVCWGEKVLEGFWPLPTPKQAQAWPGNPGCAPCASVMQSIHVRHQTTDVASCWLHLPTDLWPRPPHEAEDAEKHNVMLNVKRRTGTGTLNAHMWTPWKHQKSPTCVRGKSLHRLKHTNRPTLTKNPLNPFPSSSCVKDKSNWPALAKPCNAIET